MDDTEWLNVALLQDEKENFYQHEFENFSDRLTHHLSAVTTKHFSRWVLEHSASALLPNNQNNVFYKKNYKNFQPHQT